jgi:hypothetical protein
MSTKEAVVSIIEVTLLIAFLIAYIGVGYSVGIRSGQKIIDAEWDEGLAFLAGIIAGFTWPAVFVYHWAEKNIEL